MNYLLVLTCTVALVSGFPGGDHHGDGHEDNCVDISKYSEILYEETGNDLCTYRTKKTCNKISNTACISIPVTTCEVVAYASCESTSFVSVQHDDKANVVDFVPKQCSETGQQILIEYHQTPICQNVTKEQCDSKWVINEAGEKVWDGNENWEQVTWEDCRLESVPHPITVPTYTCTDISSISYSVPEFHEVEVTGYKSECTPAAYPLCTSTTVQQCADIEYEECFDTIEPVCFTGTFFRIPYQTYDHRLKCIE